MKTFDIVSHNIPFTIRIVEQGDNIGLKADLTHNKPEPLVEVYDTRFPHTQHGQLITRYYLSSVLDSTKGFNLDGGDKDWYIAEKEMDQVRDWLKEHPVTKATLSSGIELIDTAVKKMRFK